jgi:hypothetical protein
MRNLLALLSIFSIAASAETVINYDDGSTYTLSDNQEIYISTPNSTLFTRKLYKNKNTYFVAQEPWSKRDYVPQATDGFPVGSHEWCKAYIPWSEGFTFSMQSWQRHCDSNNDGVYDENDDRWSE